MNPALIRRLGIMLTATLLVVSVGSPALAAQNSTTESTVPAQPESGASHEGGAALTANCLGCTAGWGLWENGNTIRALRASHTDELVTFIHVHWAFIKPDPDSCSNMYDGEYAHSGFIEKNNWASDITKDANYSQGGQHHWTNAGAHKWIDDGVTWTAGYSGTTDICKDFGF